MCGGVGDVSATGTHTDTQEEVGEVAMTSIYSCRKTAQRGDARSMFRYLAALTSHYWHIMAKGRIFTVFVTLPKGKSLGFLHNNKVSASVSQITVTKNTTSTASSHTSHVAWSTSSINTIKTFTGRVAMYTDRDSGRSCTHGWFQDTAHSQPGPVFILADRAAQAAACGWTQNLSSK